MQLRNEEWDFLYELNYMESVWDTFLKRVYSVARKKIL